MKLKKKRYNKSVKKFSWLTVCGLSFFLFKDLFLHWQTVLLDWFDYPLVASVVWQYVLNFENLGKVGLFQTQMFYPETQALLFTDLFLPQGLVAIFLSRWLVQPVAVFNIIFAGTLVLNAWSAQFLWQKIFKSQLVVWLGVIVTALSPFFFAQLGHYQIISFWPSLLVMGLLISRDGRYRNILWLGLLIFCQFLMSVYLWVFLLVVIVIWLVVEVVVGMLDKKVIFSQRMRNVLAGLSLGVILVAPFLSWYFQVKAEHQVKYESQELLTSISAHLSDYLWLRLPETFVENFLVVKSWQSLNKHVSWELAVTPGIVLLLSGLIGVGLTLKKFLSPKKRALSEYKVDVFWGLVMGVGLVFSLGPRCNWNGSYCAWPLPYLAVIKVFPMLQVVRVVTRWSFLFYLGLTYFSLRAVASLTRQFSLKLRLVVIGILALIYGAETFPLDRKYEAWDYYTPVSQYLEDRCKKEGVERVVLSFPFEQLHNYQILVSLRNKSSLLLAAGQHRCRLVNGYSGFYPRGYLDLGDELKGWFTASEYENFVEVVKERRVEYLDMNWAFLPPGAEVSWSAWAAQRSDIQQVASDQNSTLYRLEGGN